MSGADVLTILYEDEDLLVVNKPPGLASAARSQDDLESTNAERLVQAMRPGQETRLLHRLDTGTSGCLAFAKNESEYERLRKAWTTPSVSKVYRALSRATPETPAVPPHRIEWPIFHSSKSKKKMEVQRGKSRPMSVRGGKLEALTEVLEARIQNGIVELTVRIETGVRHQIRVHLAGAGYPILGDAIYGGADHPRLALHAWRLEIPLKTEARLLIEAGLPSNWFG